MSRICSRCGEPKDQNEFQLVKAANGKVYFGSYCRSCQTAYQRLRRQALRFYSCLPQSAT